MSNVFNTAYLLIKNRGPTSAKRKEIEGEFGKVVSNSYFTFINRGIGVKLKSYGAEVRLIAHADWLGELCANGFEARDYYRTQKYDNNSGPIVSKQNNNTVCMYDVGSYKFRMAHKRWLRAVRKNYPVVPVNVSPFDSSAFYKRANH